MKKPILMLVIDEYISINGINIYVHVSYYSNVRAELKYNGEVHGAPMTFLGPQLNPNRSQWLFWDDRPAFRAPRGLAGAPIV